MSSWIARCIRNDKDASFSTQCKAAARWAEGRGTGRRQFAVVSYRAVFGYNSAVRGVQYCSSKVFAQEDIMKINVAV